MMFLRNWNKAREKSHINIGRHPKESAASKPTLKEDKVATATATAKADDVAVAKQLTKKGAVIMPSTTKTGAQPLRLRLAAAATHDAANKQRQTHAREKCKNKTTRSGKNSKKNIKQNHHQNIRHIRQLTNRQASDNNIEVMPAREFNSIDDDDDAGEYRNITLLEKECTNLTHILSLLRERHCKYTEEWYVLENRLKSASEELEAAREDRDLHFLSCSSGIISSSDSAGGSLRKVPTHMEENNECNVSIDYVHQLHGASTSVGVHTDTKAPITNECPANAPVVAEAKETDESIANSHNEHKNENGLISGHMCKGNEETNQHISKYRRIESELQRCIRFTPEWFQLKEELLELGGDELDCDNKEVDASIDDDIESNVCDTPKEINVLMLASGFGGTSSIDQLLTTMTSEPGIISSLIVSSPPMSPISQGSSSPQDSTHSPSDDIDDENNSDKTFGVNVRNDGDNPSNCSPPTHHRTFSCKNGTGIHKLSIYNYSFNDIDSDDDCDKEEMEEDSRNVIITELKTEHASLTEELERLPQYSKSWFELKIKIVGISEKIVRLELEEVTMEALVDNYSVGGDSESLGGDSSKNLSYSSGWSSVDVWSESDDEIWSNADELEVVMVAEALKQQPSLYIDQSSSFDDELLFTPQHDVSAMMAETEQKITQITQWVKTNEEAEQEAKLALFQAFTRGMIQRNKYSLQRRLTIRIQSMQRGSSVRSRYKQIVASVTIIQIFVRRWLTRRSKATIRQNLLEEEVLALSKKLMTYEDFSPELEIAANNLKAMQEELRIKSQAESHRDEISCGKELEGEQEEEGENGTVREENQIAQKEDFLHCSNSKGHQENIMVSADRKVHSYIIFRTDQNKRLHSRYL